MSMKIEPMLKGSVVVPAVLSFGPFGFAREETNKKDLEI
jgi:hypothetical protein